MMIAKKHKRRWRAWGSVCASTYIGVVEAATKEEAIDKAFGQADVGLCHHCSHNISDPEVNEVEVEEIPEGEEE